MPCNSLNSNSSKMNHYFLIILIEHSPRLKAHLWLFHLFRFEVNLKTKRHRRLTKKITFNWKKRSFLREILFLKIEIQCFGDKSINLARIRNVDTKSRHFDKK